MQQNEIKAVLTKTKEFAILPYHVETELPYWASGKYAVCPSGLIKATVIEDGHTYIEKRPVSLCGDRDYEITRKNGVLVEINPDDWEASRNVSRNRYDRFDRTSIGLKALTIIGKKVYLKKQRGKPLGEPLKHTEAITRDGKKYIRMIVGRKALVSSWDEYEMVEARRKKEYERQKERSDKLLIPQAALMGMTIDECMEIHHNNYREHEAAYLATDWQEVWGKDGKQKIGEVGRIAITVDQANKILRLMTKAQKARLSDNG